MRNCIAMFALCAVAWTSAAGAGPKQDHADIRDAARDHVLNHAGSFPGPIEVRAGGIDVRLQLAQCELPLEAYDSPNGLRAGRSVVGVRCTGARPWKLYVPVTIALPGPVVVTRRPLARGASLRAGDLQVIERDTANLHQAYYADPADLLGLRLTRAVGRDQVLTARMVKRATLVKRGSEVTIRAATPGMLVQMKGKALAGGGHGERIRVRNLASGRELTATITGRGVVRVAE